MINVKLTDSVFEKAKVWSEFKGNSLSIRGDGFNRYVGDLAEVVFSEMYPDAIRISDTDRNADFILKDRRIDVKCKDRTVDCKPYYEVSIETRQLINFDVDWYAFFSFNRSCNTMQFLGWISKSDYLLKSKKLNKGDIDSTNNWKVSVDCNNLKVSELIL
jgi:hypothetical protein